MRQRLPAFAVAFLVSRSLLAAEAGPSLADLSLEELGQVEVTSVSKRRERILDAPASIYVISHDEIRRSGATSLAQALRLAPNLQVAQVNASQYAITARGFNNSNNLGNKLLVLIDGRTVYSPIYSGVFWDQQDVLLEDVDRIEVISGPGGTLWGANAVNGVINVITRSAKQTQGGYATLGGGDAEYGGAFRYGAQLGETGAIRLYAKASDLDNTERADGAALADGWTMSQAGFRADWGHATRGFTLQGDMYEGRGHDRDVGGPVRANGANLLARWNEQFGSGADLQVQAYFDRSQREDPVGFQGDADTWDLEFQNGIPLGRHKILWGGGYREARDRIAATLPPSVFSFDPQSRTLSWENVFAQDEFSLTETLRLTLGIKLESNDYTGWEKLPSARLAWNPTDTQLFWGAASRAIRAPARLDRDFRWNLIGAFPAPFDNIPLIGGGPDFVSEVAEVYELGYRAQPSARLTWSVTAFYHDFDRLRSGQAPQVFQLIPAYIQNMMEGEVSGVEAWAAFQVTDNWRLGGGIVELRKELRLKPGSTDPDGPPALGNDPEHQWMLRSSMNPAPRVEFDVVVRGASRLPQPLVPAYTTVDARLGWRASQALELFVAGYNLFDPSHPEFGAAPGRSEIPRSVYAGLTWRM
ncbi:MAG TPA: TonB-dependent receptor [Burkholderiales bacterium]|jgi:iron complex outermembrane receptor protein|nr:TonB-dependent receptor [Burkholderiales bacterium]